MNATLVFRTDGTGHGLYTEAIALGELGRLALSRASSIEFNEAGQVWETRDRAGHRLFSHPSRQACLDWERNYFNERNTHEIPDRPGSTAAGLRAGGQARADAL